MKDLLIICAAVDPSLVYLGDYRNDTHIGTTQGLVLNRLGGKKSLWKEATHVE